tara:strand:+ start:206 stop:1069 length:864 start_codon:yes stop_codon:yes gene_type:complete
MAVVLGGGNGIYLASFAGPTPPPALDPDAVAFLSAAGITDPTIESAVNTLVVDMKAANIWTKMKAVYPFVGGTASTHKWNLINPLDTDAAFRLVFNGGLTHSANGVLPNGTNGYAKTFLSTGISVFPRTTGISMGYYSRTTGSHASGGNVMGSFNSSASSSRMLIRYIGAPNTSVFSHNYNDGINPNARYTSDATGSGFYIGNRKASDSELYINGSLVASNTDGNTTLNPPTETAYLFAYNNKNINATTFTNKECALAHISDALTTTLPAEWTSIVQNFQTILGRQI